MIYDPKKELDETRARVKLDSLIEKGKPFELTEKKKKRSISTNNYLHVLISLVACIEGYSLDKMKMILKQRCPFMHEYIEGIPIPLSTVNDQKIINDFIFYDKRLFKS